MARVFSPIDASGSVGDLTFAKGKNGTVLRSKSSLTREKFMRLPKLRRARENAQGFGGASKTACPIYTSIAADCKQLLMPYAHNEILRRLKLAAAKQQFVVDRYTFRTAVPVLRNLDLSHESPVKDLIKTMAFGSHHDPESIRVAGFQDAAEAIQTNGRNRIECRLELKYVRFAETQFNKEAKAWEQVGGKAKCIARSPRTDWIPTDILPTDGLRLKLEHPLPNEPVLIFLFVEWRAVNEVTDEIKPLHENAVVRLVAMQYPAAIALEIAQDDADRQAAEAQQTNQSPALWRTDPQAYLQAALKGFATAEDGG